MRNLALTMIVLLSCQLARAEEYDFYANTQYPGPTLREDVELYKVTAQGKGGPLAYERREVQWWPRKGVDIIPVKPGMPLRSWTLRSGPIKAAVVANAKPVLEKLEELQSETNMGDRFIRKIVGYLHPPATGEYTFVFAANDQGSLFLSTDEDPKNKKRVAWNNEWTKPRRWEFYPSQTSKPISLEGGKRYYIEALQQEDSGIDHLGVGWKGPGMDKISIVNGQYLSGLDGKKGSIVAEVRSVPQTGPRQAWSKPMTFKAHLVGFRGMGNTMTSKWGGSDGGPREPGVVLRLADGRKRFFATGSFVAKDKKYIMALFVKEMNRIKAGLVKRKYVARVNAKYPNNAKPGEPGTMTVESEHFVWVSGSQSGGKDDPWVSELDPETATWFRDGSKECAEFFWALNEYAGHCMPFWSAGTEPLSKYEITVAGTKRDGYKVIPGYAGGGGGGCIIKGAGGGPWAMSLFHEWGHGVTFGPQQMGGGEATADTYKMFPDPSGANKDHHILRPWRNVFNGGNGYTFCSFYNFVGEDPNWGYGHFAAMPNGVDEWSYLMTMARAGQQRGMFKNGIAGLGDTVGEYGARLTTFDCEQEDVLRRLYYAPTRNWLETVDAKTGRYRIPLEEAPEPFGVNMTQLVADNGAKEIVVDFTGMHDPGLYSDWRACIIAISADGSRRYSPMWSKGKMSLPIESGDVSHWLSVAATPTAFYAGKKSRGRNRLDKRTLYSGRHAYRYPWSIQMTGARPGTPRESRADYDDADLIYKAADSVPTPHDTPAGKRLLKKLRVVEAALLKQQAQPTQSDLQLYFLPTILGQVQTEIARMTQGARHPNGGGWVMSTATVAPTAYVGPSAMVLGQARVLDNAIVDDFAVVTDQAVVSGNARICGQGLVKNEAQATGYARVWQTVEKRDVATIMPKRPGAKGVEKNGLWANYAMDQDDPAILEDGFRYAISANKGYAADLTPVLNGYLYGRPEFVVDGEHRGFRFNGTDQYAELCPRAADMGEITIDLAIKPGRSGEQTLFDLGCSTDNRLLLTLSKNLTPTLSAIVGGTRVLKLVGKTPLTIDQWASVRVEIDGKTAALFVNDTLASEQATTFRPSDVFPGGQVKRNFLAAGRDGKTPFAGVVDHVVIYHDVHDDYAALPAPIHDAPVRPSAEYMVALAKKNGDLAMLNRASAVMAGKMLTPYKVMEKKSHARQAEIMARCPEYVQAVAAEGAAEAALNRRKGELEGQLKKAPEIVQLLKKMQVAREKTSELRRQTQAAEQKAAKVDPSLLALTAKYREAEKKMRAITQRLKKEFDQRPDVVKKVADIKALRTQAGEMRRKVGELEQAAIAADAPLQARMADRAKADTACREIEKTLQTQFDARGDATQLAAKMQALNKRRHDKTLSKQERDTAGKEADSLRRERSSLWENVRQADAKLRAAQRTRDQISRPINERQRALRETVRKEHKIARTYDALNKRTGNMDRALQKEFRDQVLDSNKEYGAIEATRNKVRNAMHPRREELRADLQASLPVYREYTQAQKIDRALSASYRGKRDAYVGKGSMALERKLGEAKGAVVEAEKVAWLAYGPERWLYSFNQQTYRGYYNTPYNDYIRERARDVVGGGEMRENSNALESLANASSGNDPAWTTVVNWDWRIPPEIQGTIKDNPLLKQWLGRVRGPALKQRPAPLK